MLEESELPQHWWAEAMLTATHTKNNLYHESTKQIPFTHISQLDPDARRRYPFGTPCINYNQRQSSVSKLHLRGSNGRFIGYNSHNTKGYRILDQNNERVINVNVKDVKFVQNDTVSLSSIISPNDDEIALMARAANEMLELPPEPISFQDAMQQSDSEKWSEAINAEMSNLESKGTWTIIDRPTSKKDLIVKGKWVFKRKLNPNGSIAKYKARYVAKGFTQRKGVHYNETYAPVARIETERIIIALAMAKSWDIEAIDVNGAYLIPELDKKILIELPEGHPQNGSKVANLHKALYGLHQSGFLWNKDITEFLKKNGLTQAKTEPSIFFAKDIILIIYVDDILFLGNTIRVKEYKSIVMRQYECEDQGEVKHLLGISFIKTEDNNTLSQKHYINKMLEEFNMTDSKPVSTPMIANFNPAAPPSEKAEHSCYRKAIGCLLYIANCTRPDIAFAVNRLSQYVTNNTAEHWTAVKRIMRYLRGSSNKSITYDTTKDGHIDVLAYTDASYGDNDDRRSTSGCIITINNKPVTWFSRKQSIVAQSTVEAEYIALSEAAKQVTWIINMLEEIGPPLHLPVTVMEDNQGTIQLARNQIISHRY